jgi:hypothetical protein
MARYQCPVCGYRDLPREPREFLICPSCGTEFGYDDANPSEPRETVYARLRLEWVTNDAPWFSQSTQPPPGWDAYAQLRAAGFRTTLSTATHAETTSGGSLAFDISPVLVPSEAWS